MIKNIWEKIRAIFGIGGAVLISMNINLEWIAFTAYLISNAAWLTVAYKKNISNELGISGDYIDGLCQQ